MYSVTIYLSSTLMLMMNSPSCFNNLAAFPLEHKFVTMHIMNIILCIITLYFTLHRFCRLSRLKSVQQMIYLRRFLPRLCFHSLGCKIEQFIYCLWKLDLFMHALPITNSDIVYYNLGTNSLLDISYFVDFIEILKKRASFLGKSGK